MSTQKTSDLRMVGESPHQSYDADKPRVTRLRRRDIDRASKTFSDGFADDPLMKYLRNNRPRTPKDARAERLTLWAFFWFWISSRLTLTIKSGLAVISIELPKQTTKPSTFVDRVVGWIGNAVFQLYLRLNPAWKQGRSQKTKERLDRLVEEVLGERVKEMIYVETLVTAPEHQGHGYGGALLEAAADLADARGQTAWLKSANPTNTKFYNQHGYVSYGEAVVSDDDPSWEGPPVVVLLMVRERKGAQIKA